MRLHVTLTNVKSYALGLAIVVVGCSDRSAAPSTTPSDVGAPPDVGVDATSDAASTPEASSALDAAAVLDATDGGAGAPDAGVRDVGTEDASVSVPDAGPRDAATDASARDASFPDGSFDAAVDASFDAAFDAGPTDAALAPPDGASAGPNVVGFSGIAEWSSLPAAERARLASARFAFLHQSVGQDLEDGAEANGFRFDYVTSADLVGAPGLSGGLFSTSNGNGLGKVSEWRSFALRNGAARVAIASMKFGYADIAGNLAPIQGAYAAASAALRGAGIRVMHVTPPLVYASPADNAGLMAMRAWMLATFPSDVVFDLADAESVDPTTGARCERGGSWEICDRVRSTRGCASGGQGIDAPSGQGHLCLAQATRIAKAFLLAIHRASR